MSLKSLERAIQLEGYRILTGFCMVTLDDKVVAEVLPPEEVIGVLSRFVAVFESPKKPTPRGPITILLCFKHGLLHPIFDLIGTRKFRRGK